jgi:hypothetical protein
MDDDQMSAKVLNGFEPSYVLISKLLICLQTSSSQTSSVFKEFLRRSSKKYKRAKGKLVPHPSMEDEVRSDDVSSARPNSNDATTLNEVYKVSDEENSNPTTFGIVSNSNQNITSPLSLVPTELNLMENSRNRKPIYISQTESTSH